MKTFSERLQGLIDQKKISQRELAEGVGVNESRISEWVSGRIGNPRRVTLLKLADYFGCNLDWLATGKGSMFPDKANQKIHKIAPSEKALRNYTEIAVLDSETLGEIQTWLNEQEKIKPGFTSWFRLEFSERFPEFETWKEKIIKTEASG